MSVTVYTSPGCVRCKATMRHLMNKDVPFETVDLSTDSQAKQRLADEGFTSLPVVDVDGEMFSGFRPDKLDALAKASA